MSDANLNPANLNPAELNPAELNPAELATRSQRAAARPGVSVSLRASAGSGKTRVLVDRFLRLCVENPAFPADPASILAVTFTRKAAVEIKERLLRAARDLALATPEGCRARLAALFGVPEDQVTAGQTALAAGLYERMLGDVSALNVGTIHSFCQTILNRFAAEAGHDPHALLLENTRELEDEALDALDRRILTDPELTEAARLVGGDPGQVRHALTGAFEKRLYLDRWLRGLAVRRDGDRHDGDWRVSRGRGLLLEAAREDLTTAVLADWDLPGNDPAGHLWPRLGQALADAVLACRNLEAQGPAPGAEDKVVKSLGNALAKVGQKLEDLQDEWPSAPPLESSQLVRRAREVFLTTRNEPRKHVRAGDDPDKLAFNAQVLELGLPLLDLTRAWTYLDLLAPNLGLLRLTLELMDTYDAIKRRDQVLDFHDLEELACVLMGDEARALSLLYRLDDGLNHILLDEFQDTNFNQWEILEPFVSEFLAGDEERRKTVFMVGDVKQSIYSFRGAEPRLFLQAAARLEEAGQLVCTLPTNFRSLEAVVSSVGCVFAHSPLRELLPPGEDAHQHWCRREDRGQVVVLDPLADQGEGRDLQSGDLQAAEAAARWVRRLVNGGALTWDDRHPDPPGPRPLTWDDVLVLCRGRTEIAVYEKAFREQGIPIVPAGRGMLAAGREVQDLLALLRWLTYPQDDVPLATVLRSPLFRLSEEDFQAALAARFAQDDGAKRRVSRLWTALRRRQDDPRFTRAVRLLHKWRGHLGRESAHDLLRRVFREGEVLERYALAMGDQARFNLLRLFDIALGSEVGGTPTVRRLAQVIDQAARLGSEEEADTPVGSDSGRVRFMTIHGAKGLERPLVFLVDADREPIPREPMLRLRPEDSRSPLLLKTRKEQRQGAPELGLPPTRLEEAARDRDARDAAEDANLLYVAMTRARDRLVVLGGDKARGQNHDSPLRRLIAASAECPLVEREAPPAWDEPMEEEAVGPELPDGVEAEAGTRIATRTWQPPVMRPLLEIKTPSAVAADEEQAPFRPADEVDDRAADAGARQAALARGTLVHEILQQAADAGALPPGEGAAHAEAAAVFREASLAWVFDPAAEQGRGLSEVPVIHRIIAADGREQRVTGSIDRLVIRPDGVDVIDYKTNRVGDDAARLAQLRDHYRPQLTSYREAVTELFPHRPVRAWLLFTDPDLSAGARLQEVT